VQYLLCIRVVRVRDAQHRQRPPQRAHHTRGQQAAQAPVVRPGHVVPREVLQDLRHACCAVLCCAMLCYAKRCYEVLVLLCCAMLCLMLAELTECKHKYFVSVANC
jgi:hypothetical protein